MAREHGERDRRAGDGEAAAGHERALEALRERDGTMVSDIGRNVRPASSGEKPSTCWRYSVTRNHIEKAVAPRQKATTLAPDSARERKIRSGTSGAAARRPSTSRKNPSSAAPAAIGPSVAAAPHPWRSLLTMP